MISSFICSAEHFLSFPLYFERVLFLAIDEKKIRESPLTPRSLNSVGLTLAKSTPMRRKTPYSIKQNERKLITKYIADNTVNFSHMNRKIAINFDT